MGAHHHDIPPSYTPEFRRAVWGNFWINTVMAGVEIFASIFSHSLALMADAMDFISDSSELFISLIAMKRSKRVRLYAALFNASTMFALGITILWHAVGRFYTPVVPNPAIVGSVGAMALVANLVCAMWLFRYRSGDALQKSLWLCARNDAMNDVAVVISAFLTVATQSHWPDLIIALGIVVLELVSTWHILQHVREEWHEAHHGEHQH